MLFLDMIKCLFALVSLAIAIRIVHIYSFWERLNKVECVFPLVIITILPHAEFGQNDHWEDAPDFISFF